MGLSNRLHDVSGDSLVLLVVAAAASLLSHLRLLLLPLPSLSPSVSIPSSLSALVAIAGHLSSSAPSPSSPYDGDCAVCLSPIADGDRARRLACRHAFHAACIDGWLLRAPSAAAGGSLLLRCPVCRSPVVPAVASADVDRRIGADLVAWLSHY